MIKISKDAAKYLRERIHDVCICKTMRKSGSKRGAYYVEEVSKVRRALAEYESGINVVSQYPEYPVQ